MKLETLGEVERSLGGRPKLDSTKVRMTFYLAQSEADALRCMADQLGVSVSLFVRSLIRREMNEVTGIKGGSV